MKIKNEGDGDSIESYRKVFPHECKLTRGKFVGLKLVYGIIK